MTKKEKETRRVQAMHKKQKMKILIDGENISYKKADDIIKVAEQQGIIFSSQVYGLQKDEHTKGWTDEAKKYGIKDIRLFGRPEKDKVDKKIQKDAMQTKNIDIVCFVTSDKGYSDTVKQLRKQGKRVIIIGEEKTPYVLRNACDEFIEI